MVAITRSRARASAAAAAAAMVAVTRSRARVAALARRNYNRKKLTKIRIRRYELLRKWSRLRPKASVLLRVAFLVRLYNQETHTVAAISKIFSVCTNRARHWYNKLGLRLAFV